MTPNHRRWLARLLAAGGCLAAVGLTGCQSDIGGQVLPSANYQLTKKSQEDKESKISYLMQQRDVASSSYSSSSAHPAK